MSTKQKDDLYYQQGDVLFKPDATIPAGARALFHGVVQEGEHTGHAHRLQGIPGQAFSLFEFRHAEDGAEVSTRYLIAHQPVTIAHEEHRAFELPAGTYEIGVVLEFNYEAMEARNVVD